MGDGHGSMRRALRGEATRARALPPRRPQGDAGATGPSRGAAAARRVRHALALSATALAACLAACGGSEDDATTDTPAAEDVPGHKLLVSRTWSVPPGGERYVCRRIRLAADLWITRFAPLSPSGTHHVGLTLSQDDAPPGDYECGSASVEPLLLYATGADAAGYAMPEGVALHLRAGQLVNLDLHVLNVASGTLVGDSGVEVDTVAATDVEEAAELVLAGVRSFTIPAHAESLTVGGGGTLDRACSVFAVAPRMRRLGEFQALAVERDGVATTVRQGLYTFGEERVYPVSTTALRAGDRLDVTCTFSNITNRAASAGDTASEEMCFSALYRYPATGGDPFAYVQ